MWSALVYTRLAVYTPSLREPALTGCWWTIPGQLSFFVLEHDRKNCFVTLTC